MDDLILLGVRAGANQEALNYLDVVDKKRGINKSSPSLFKYNSCLDLCNSSNICVHVI